jgi:hypothetical protein
METGDFVLKEELVKGEPVMESSLKAGPRRDGRGSSRSGAAEGILRWGGLEGLNLFSFFSDGRSHMEEFIDIDACIGVHEFLLFGYISLGPAKASYEPSLRQLAIVGRGLKIEKWGGSLSIEVPRLQGGKIHLPLPEMKPLTWN